MHHYVHMSVGKTGRVSVSEAKVPTIAYLSNQKENIACQHVYSLFVVYRTGINDVFGDDVVAPSLRKRVSYNAFFVVQNNSWICVVCKDLWVGGLWSGPWYFQSNLLRIPVKLKSFVPANNTHCQLCFEQLPCCSTGFLVPFSHPNWRKKPQQFHHIFAPPESIIRKSEVHVSTPPNCVLVVVHLLCSCDEVGGGGGEFWV